MAKITTSDFKKGNFILFKDQPHQIVDFQRVNPGKGSAFVRTRLKSLSTGHVQEFTYKSGESVEEVPINTHEMQYLYKEMDKYVFMDNRTYDQFQVEKDIIGTFVDYLKEGEIYQLLEYQEIVVGMRVPKKVRLKVTEAAEGSKGNTQTSATKTVVVETGATVTVPLFIKEGELIAIDPETGTYIERATEK